MRYNINKLQGGGLVAFTPIINSPKQKGGGQAESQEQTSLLDDEIYKELMNTGGLINDVNQFVSDIEKLDSDPFSFLNPKTQTSAIRMIGKVNEIKQNRKMWEDSSERAYTNGGYSEVAVGSSGELYTKDNNGNIITISMNQYKKDNDKYSLLTVSDLLNARQHDPKLSYNQGIFKIADQAIGINKVTDHIEAIISKLGKDTQSTEFYKSKDEIGKEFSELNNIKKPTAEQIQGIQELQKLGQAVNSGPNGIYKFKEAYSSNKGHVKDAFGYIWSTLPANYQNKLKATILLNGGDISDTGTILANALGMFTDEESTISTDYQKDMSSSGSSGGSSETATPLSNVEMFFSGKLDRGETFQWNDPDSGLIMSIPITGKMLLVDDKKPIGRTTLSEFGKTSMSQYTDITNATFGGKKLDVSDSDKIVYDGGQAARAYMPTNYDGTPNYKIMKQFKEAENVVAQNPDWDSETINEYYHDRGLDYIKVDENKKYLTNLNFKPFLIFYGYTTDEAGVIKDSESDTGKNKNIEKLNNEDEINSMLGGIYKTAKVASPTGWTGGGWSTDYYKGLVAIPIHEDASAMTAADEKHLFTNKYSITDVRTNMAKQQYGKQIPQSYSSSSLLK